MIAIEEPRGTKGSSHGRKPSKMFPCRKKNIKEDHGKCKEKQVVILNLESGELQSSDRIKSIWHRCVNRVENHLTDGSQGRSSISHLLDWQLFVYFYETKREKNLACGIPQQMWQQTTVFNARMTSTLKDIKTGTNTFRSWRKRFRHLIVSLTISYM